MTRHGSALLAAAGLSLLAASCAADGSDADLTERDDLVATEDDDDVDHIDHIDHDRCGGRHDDDDHHHGADDDHDTWTRRAGEPTPCRSLEIGRSVQDRPIVAVERGTPGGTVVVVIGVIHGDEDDGVAIVERLATAPVPPGVSLWLIESMNPDGQALRNAATPPASTSTATSRTTGGRSGNRVIRSTPARRRQRARDAGDRRLPLPYRPTLGLWYHQDLYRLSPARGWKASSRPDTPS